MKQHRFRAVVAFVMMAAMMCFVLPCEVFAGDEQTQLQDRQISFAYGYTECTGEVHEVSDANVSPYNNFTEYYKATMMLCDTDHKICAIGEGVTDSNVTYESLTPDVLEVDNEGNVTLHKTGEAGIYVTVAADETYAQRSQILMVTADRHDAWNDTGKVYYEGRSPEDGLTINIADGPQQLVLPLRPGVKMEENVSYSLVKGYDDVLSIDENGVLTPLLGGNVVICFHVDGGDKYKSCEHNETIRVNKLDQEITGNLGPYDMEWQKGVQLDLHAPTRLEYQVVAGSSFATVDENGFFRATRYPGVGGEGHGCRAIVKVTAVGDRKYYRAEVKFFVNVHDYAREKAAARKREIEKAQNMERPVITVKALRGRKNKISWNKVDYADGYIVYVKIPGKKKFVKAVTRSKKVKSVTHKGLTKGKVYYYKVRAYKKLYGKTYYTRYSKVKKARVRR